MFRSMHRIVFESISLRRITIQHVTAIAVQAKARLSSPGSITVVEAKRSEPRDPLKPPT